MQMFKQVILTATIALASHQVVAGDLYFGVQGTQSQPLNYDSFKSRSSTGDGWGAELG
jgi:hypothetical protein